MKKILFALALFAVASPAYAWNPNVAGHRTIATPTHVVIGGIAYEVEAVPTTRDGIVRKIEWLEAQVFEIQRSETAIR